MNEILSTETEFRHRHIGPSQNEKNQMLKTLGLESLQELSERVIPKSIRTQNPYPRLGSGLSEIQALQKLKTWMGENRVAKSYIGMGFHDTLTPSVIQRTLFENPLWYTAYTPYQPEISQGRLEALLNFQTMVMDLTQMEIANASLLDEGTAAAEAMAMAHSLAKNKSNIFIVSENLHPHVITVLQTRAEPLGLDMRVQKISQNSFQQPVFAVFTQYPGSDGEIASSKDITAQVQAQGGLSIVGVDLLALCLLEAPGSWGADLVYGNSQRFGVPLGNGGPHAAFLATKDAYKRLLPGRLVGVSVDSRGQKALRLTLQTREQHIRREKATSNICTAQVLLANMASMYAVYHGPHGLKKIAERVHALTALLAQGLKSRGYQLRHSEFFDTLTVETPKSDSLCAQAEKAGMNFRKLSGALGISLNECTTEADVSEILKVFEPGSGAVSAAGAFTRALPSDLTRKTPYLTHPVFNSHHSETQLLRYITHLQSLDLTLAQSMIPLGSCTMKLNAASELVPVSWPEVNRIHPFAPANQMLGYSKMVRDLEDKLADITGFAGVSIQPNAGSQGEYAGLLVIRKYLQSQGQGHRKVCLIPSSAHGTNPASAVMAGFSVVVVQCDELGNVDVEHLKLKAQEHSKNLAALMITYPSTHGVFEESIREICEIVHTNGGQVYMDGANLNALVGLCRPGEFGPDVCHMNLHKTFSIPHGGGGPGVGPIGVAKHLTEFLPGSSHGIQAVTSAHWGSASILPISWMYITMMGEAGLREATLTAILNANYIAKRMDPYFPVLYKGRSGFVAHECIVDLRHLKKFNLDVTDVAKRLMDYGFHAPTMSWPVAGTLMIEPTESEGKAEMDRFIDALISIRQEIAEVESGKMDPEKNTLKLAPFTVDVLLKAQWDFSFTREQAAFPRPWVKAQKFWPAVGRIDNAYGDRNVMCSCPPLDEYSEKSSELSS